MPKVILVFTIQIGGNQLFTILKVFPVYRKSHRLTWHFFLIFFSNTLQAQGK